MTKYSNKLAVNVTSSGGGGGGGGGDQPNLEITDYNVSILCPSFGGYHQIEVTGTVLYNGKPLPHVTVYIGFCSAYDPTTHTLVNGLPLETDENGKFRPTKLSIATHTPPGGQNCIIALVYYNNMYATATATATVPSC
jgi:hypothetical protein